VEFDPKYRLQRWARHVDAFPKGSGAQQNRATARHFELGQQQPLGDAQVLDQQGDSGDSQANFDNLGRDQLF